MRNKKYVEVIYNEKDRPFTSYPKKFVRYIFDRYKFKEKSNLLELGCGRGDFINEFSNLGLDVHAIDLSDLITSKFPKIKFNCVDLLKENLPYPDNYFDVIYSKSFSCNPIKLILANLD